MVRWAAAGYGTLQTPLRKGTYQGLTPLNDGIWG